MINTQIVTNQDLSFHQNCVHILIFLVKLMRAHQAETCCSTDAGIKQFVLWLYFTVILRFVHCDFSVWQSFLQKVNSNSIWPQIMAFTGFCVALTQFFRRKLRSYEWMSSASYNERRHDSDSGATRWVMKVRSWAEEDTRLHRRFPPRLKSASRTQVIHSRHFVLPSG